MKKIIACFLCFVWVLSFSSNIVLGDTYYGHPKVTQYTKAIKDMVAFEEYQDFIGFLVELEDRKGFEKAIHGAYHALSYANQNRLEPEVLMMDICIQIANDIDALGEPIGVFYEASVDWESYGLKIQEDYLSAYSLLASCNSAILTEGLEELEMLMAVFKLNLDMGSDIISVNNDLEDMTVNMDIINMLLDAMISFDADAKNFASSLSLIDYIVDYYNDASLHDRELIYFSLLENGFVGDVGYEKTYEGIGDLSGYQWAEAAIYKLADYDVISGREIDYMAPAEGITRAEIVVMISRLLTITDYKAVDFQDVSPEDWFYEDLCKAVEIGIISGKPGHVFDPKGQLSRGEFATIIGRVLTLYDTMTISPNSDQIIKGYNDGDRLPSWAKDYIALMTQYGIIKGIPSNNVLYYMPEDNTTRAEAAVILYRMSSVTNTIIR